MVIKRVIFIFVLIVLLVVGYLFLLPPPPKTMTQAELVKALNSTSSKSTSSKKINKYVLDFDRGMLEGAVMLYLLDNSK